MKVMEVLQDWVRELSFMQQSVLMAAIRAPDNLAKNHPAKKLMRWYRRCILNCAFCKKVHGTADEWCSGSFTGPLSDVDDLAKQYLVNVDEIPHHFHLHLLHAAQIIGYKHPNDKITYWWRDFYYRGIVDMHLTPETCGEMDRRLSDSPAEWKRREAFPAE
jgi:hypothetical protein